MKINIYQIYFKQEQKQGLDPAFTPISNIGAPSSELREWPLIRGRGYETAKADGCDVWGFFSWKFQQKCNMIGKHFVDHIKNNPDADCWYMEPQHHPYAPWRNQWMQGQQYHPHLQKLINKILQQKYPNTPDVAVEDIPWCFGSFYAGTAEFWDKFLRWNHLLLQHVSADPELKRLMYDTPAGHGIAPELPYYAFVMERSFTTFVYYEKQKAAALPYYHLDYVYNR